MGLPVLEGVPLRVGVSVGLPVRDDVSVGVPVEDRLPLALAPELRVALGVGVPDGGRVMLHPTPPVVNALPLYWPTNA